MAYSDQNMVPKLHLEALQTVTPFKATDPRQTRRVLLATDPVDSGIFQRCLNIVVYYKKVEEEDYSGWITAGWIKESLGRFLAEQPMLCGRLRRSEDGVGGIEVVSNDSGVRLIEAKFPLTLSEFLDDHLKENEDAEAELVFWKDIDEQFPQFSPLFYVQVTNFECGGYSIGISCTLLLADILIKENFFKKWANIHKDIISKNNSLKTPIFFVPHLKKASSNPAIPISSNQVKKGQTVIFNVTEENLGLEKESSKKLILAQVEEMESELGSKMASKFPVYLKESSNVIKIEYCSKNVDALIQSQLDFKSQVSKVSWDELVGASEIDFGQDNKPGRLTCWIGSILDGVVVATPDDSDESTSGLNIIVSVPT